MHCSATIATIAWSGRWGWSRDRPSPSDTVEQGDWSLLDPHAGAAETLAGRALTDLQLASAGSMVRSLAQA